MDSSSGGDSPATLVTTAGVVELLRDAGIRRTANTVRAWEAAGRLLAVRVHNGRRAPIRVFRVSDVARLISTLQVEGV